MNTLYLLLGGNIGNVQLTIKNALELLNEELGAITSTSKYYQTAAWGNTAQADFINQACKIRTKYNAIECLKKILLIEQKLGRIRKEKWGARVIDIDIQYFNNEVLNTIELTIPHPEIQNRKFALIPLCDIIPEYIHPILQKSNIELLNNLDDPLSVREME